MKNKKPKLRRSKKITKIFTDRVSKVLKELEDDEIEIKRLERGGHSYHCACRIVWGDGQCECKRGEKIESYTYNQWTENGKREQEEKIK